MPTLLVTGGAGFIGSNLVRQAVAQPGASVVVLDKLTYAGRRESLPQRDEAEALTFVRGDIADGPLVANLLQQHRPDAVIHLAAESHVDRSIDAPHAFIQTNVMGTSVLLEECLKHWESLAEADQASFRFVHASTDEVFGSLGAEGRFDERSPYQPNSPYSASKAASDHLVRAFHQTYGLPTVTCNSSNNYGPRQHPEKLFPTIILSAADGKPLPVYGDGLQVRDWLHVADQCGALLTLAHDGAPGEVYLVGAQTERANLDVVRAICRSVDELRPLPGGAPCETLIRHVADRPGHDRRYALDATKIRQELGWRPSVDFEDGVRQTVRWYLDNPAWVQAAVSKDGLRRRGLRSKG